MISLKNSYLISIMPRRSDTRIEFVKKFIEAKFSRSEIYLDYLNRDIPKLSMISMLGRIIKEGKMKQVKILVATQ